MIGTPISSAKSFSLPAPQGMDYLKKLRSPRPVGVFYIHTFQHPDNTCGTILQNEVVKFNHLVLFLEGEGI